MPDQQIDDRLNELGETLRRQPSVRNAVMRRVTEAAAAGAPHSAPWLSRRTLAKLVALAACVLIVALLWNARGPMGAQEAFAAAIANVAKARTFSWIQIHKFVEDGREQVQETAGMFKEPDRERTEIRQGWPSAGEVTITDYAKRRRLLLLPDKTAVLQDISTHYEVDPATGKLVPTELDTRVRDEVLKISAQAVKDLGMSKLGDQEVRVLRSQDDGEPIKTVYVNPKTNAPVQIELFWPSRKASFTYASIRIDQELDDALFSLEAPAGYAPAQQERHQLSEYHVKMLSKMRYLMLVLYEHASKHDMQFPAELAELTKDRMDAKVLKTLLADPDQPDGPPVIAYRRPEPGKQVAPDAIVVYETPETRRDEKVVAGFGDGHAEVMSKDYFEKKMK